MKLVLFVFTFFAFLTMFANPASAGFVTISTTGDVIVHVLGAEDEIGDSSLEITKIEAPHANKNGNVALARTGDKVYLTVDTEDGEKKLDVTNTEETLVEIEERPKVQKVTIKAEGDTFLIEHKGITVRTKKEIRVDPTTARLSLTSDFGTRFLAIMPAEAVNSVVRAKFATKVDNTSLTIEDVEGGELVYAISGQKVLNILNLLSYPVDVVSKVSISTGEVVSVNQPLWLTVASYIFS